MLKVALLLFIVKIFVTHQQEVVINTAQGKLRGIREDHYFSFIGIPYASLNGSATRFKRAGPAPSWVGIRESHGERLPCYPKSSGIEDCLQLDVYVPYNSIAGPWPVLVWVHGGEGTYHPLGLVKKGLILVAVSYRFGPLGFLCLNNDKAPGNAGVKDLVLSLRWVRDNIVAFRGDPSKVIVAGHSLGAALVEALILSPMVKNLFHGAILQSGSVLCPWAFNYDAQERAKLLVKMLTKSSNEEVMYNTLLETKPLELTVKSTKLILPYFPFGMCAEKVHKKEELFLSEPPIKILKNKTFKRVPLMVGYNSNEAYIFASYLKKRKILKKLINDMTFILPEELLFLSKNEVKQATKLVKDLYFSDNITMDAVLAYHRDAYFVNHIHRSVRYHATVKGAPMYYYQFSYNGNLGVEPEDGIKKTGAAHSDELAYLFAEDDNNDGTDGALIRERMLTLWSNFVKYLNPTPPSANLVHWEAVKAREPRVYNIDVDAEMRDFPHARATQLWDGIYEKYYYTQDYEVK